MKKDKEFMAILEFDLPESCNMCPCGKYDTLNFEYYCGVTKKRMFMDSFFKKRMRKCPIKIRKNEE